VAAIVCSKEEKVGGGEARKLEATGGGDGEIRTFQAVRDRISSAPETLQLTVYTAVRSSPVLSGYREYIIRIIIIDLDALVYILNVLDAISIHGLLTAWTTIYAWNGTPFVNDVNGGIHQDNRQHGLPTTRNGKYLFGSMRIRYFIVICSRGKRPCSQGRSLRMKYVHKVVEQPSVIMLVSNDGAEAKCPPLPLGVMSSDQSSLDRV
jgi:hypothetical protein